MATAYFKNDTNEQMCAIGSFDLWGICDTLIATLNTEEEQNQHISAEEHCGPGELGSIFSLYRKKIIRIRAIVSAHHKNKSLAGQARGEIRGVVDAVVGGWRRLFSSKTPSSSTTKG